MTPVKELLHVWRADPEMTPAIAIEAFGLEGCASTTWTEVEIVATLRWHEMNPGFNGVEQHKGPAKTLPTLTLEEFIHREMYPRIR